MGAFLPLLPTTPFLLLTAWCFLKSSDRAYNWLASNPYLGPPLRDWQQHQAISVQTKIVATLMIIASVAGIWYKVHIPAIKYSVSAGLLVVTIFILTRKSYTQR